MSCSHRLFLVLKSFSHPKKKAHTHQAGGPPLFSPQPLVTTVRTMSQGTAEALGSDNVWPFVPGLFGATECFRGSRMSSLESLPRSSLWPNDIYFMDVPPCVSPLICDGYFGCFLPWAMVHGGTGAFVCIWLRPWAQFPLCIHLSVGLLSHTVIVRVAVYGAVKLFFHSG